MRVRPANAADVPSMIDLEQKNPTAAHWSREQYENLFAANDQPRPERFALIVDHEVIDDEIVEDERVKDGMRRERALSRSSSIIGFAVARRIDAEWELENIVVAENVRRREIGTLLLTKLLDLAREQGGGTMFLEVRESNRSARALYRRMAFEETGHRPNYYASPAESAVLYRLRLG